MVVHRNIHKVNAEAPHIPIGNPLKNRIGFWGIVKEVNSLNNTVTVVSDTGYEYPNIQVKSDEWVTLDKNYVPSTRNLPPKKSRVFVITPTFSAVGAFVLCSGFSRGDENIRTLWAADKNELEDKNNCRETKTQGGWDVREEYANGNFSAESNDGNIKFNVNTTEDSDKSQPKEVSVTAWGNTIIINEDGISVTDANDNTFISNQDGITVTDSKDNLIQSGEDEGKSFLKLEVVAKTEGVVTSKGSILVESDKVTVNEHLTVSTQVGA